MNIQDVRKVVGSIKSSLFKNSNAYSIGMLKSHFRGSGLQFKEHQIYTHGDDVRFIDWKLLAKTNTPYIKTFEEERNVEIVVVVDASPTMFSGYNNISKLQASIEICCLLYLLAAETNDFIHAIIVGDEIADLPKMSGEEGIIRLVAKLESLGILTSEGKLNLAYASEERKELKNREKLVMRHLHHKREVVLLSDFNEFIELKNLKRILYRSNVHCFQVLSPLDEAEQVPYTLLSRTPFQKGDRGKLVKLNLTGSKDLDSLWGKRVKKLRVHERYLEEFVKEML
jgi:uncharacterized protein (DUF58 family)